MNVPQKHHYVPQFLLRRFADQNKKLLVHRTDKRERPQRAPVRKTAQTLSGHSLYWPGREPDHTSIEAGMSSIETATNNVIASLLDSTVHTPSEEQREVLGFFIALQWHRSRFLIDNLKRSVLDPDAPTDELAKSIGVRQILTSVLFPWCTRRDDESTPAATYCYPADWLQHGPWSWHLYRPTGHKLVVGDNIVCMWDIAAQETSEMPVAWTHHGVGIGFGNCGRITIPLAPNLGLIIHRTNRPDLRKLDAAGFNRATIYNSKEFIAHHPNGLPSSSLQGALLQDLSTQRQILPIIIETTHNAAEQEARQFAQQLQQADQNPFFT